MSRSYEEKIRKWVERNICVTTIHQTLTDQFGFAGSYSSVRRLVQRLKLHQPEASIPIFEMTMSKLILRTKPAEE